MNIYIKDSVPSYTFNRNQFPVGTFFKGMKPDVFLVVNHCTNGTDVQVMHMDSMELQTTKWDVENNMYTKLRPLSLTLVKCE